MQQAYASEANVYGSWKLIGYTAPGNKAENSSDGSSQTTNFKYIPATIEGDTTSGAVTDAWAAQNVAKLNDCPAEVSNWTVSTKPITGGVDAYVSKVNNDDCKPLTPTFANIGGSKADATSEDSSED